MKAVFYLIIIVCLTACRKELGTCKNYKELNGTEQLLDAGKIDIQAFRDTLNKYPQLKAHSYITDAYSKQLRCSLFYNNLVVFQEEYSLVKQENSGAFQENGKKSMPSLSVSTTPTIHYKKAIENARKYINFDYACISYQLGIYNVSYSSNDYRLAWKIMNSNNQYSFVICDATTNDVLTVNGSGWWLY